MAYPALIDKASDLGKAKWFLLPFEVITSHSCYQLIYM